MAGCATTPTLTPSPLPVTASNPTVTYVYRTDEQLVQANQNATVFCNQYQTLPRTQTMTGNPDGTKTVVFECVGPAAPIVTPAPVPPGQRYVYRTDQELVQASQTASAYCARNSALPMTSSIATNQDGTRTVVFQCAR